MFSFLKRLRKSNTPAQQQDVSTSNSTQILSTPRTPIPALSRPISVNPVVSLETETLSQAGVSQTLTPTLPIAHAMSPLPPPDVTATEVSTALPNTIKRMVSEPLSEVSIQSAFGGISQGIHLKTAETPTQKPIRGINERIIGTVPPPAYNPDTNRLWLIRLKSGLNKTSAGLSGIFSSVKFNEALFEKLESELLMADVGLDATTYLLNALRQRVRSEKLTDTKQIKQSLRRLLIELLMPLELSIVLGRAQPLVIMIVGVNGAGKTTSIGKLAKHLQLLNQSVILASGDTFRAAAREQLVIWGQRNNITVIQQESADPSAVIFDAVHAARARRMDVLIADTAGRLPTQLHLMQELRKVKRVIGKAMEGAPHEILLVLDANTGQNTLAQVKAFDESLGLTGLIITKLDGTAKGGVLAAIARQHPVPVYFIGVGENIEDLQPFVADEFADALLG
ncbi:Signal recognition particle receptor FtsY [Candidatus Vallotia lariciata]|nr:Signal recognition particle receptor FtsY [Candidatus Vallotia lariciata]